MATTEAQNTKAFARAVTSLESLSSVAKRLQASGRVPYPLTARFLLPFFFCARFLVLGPAEGRGEDNWVAYQCPDPGAV